MSGIFASFNTARRGLFAQQTAVDTTTHNIANASTKGYSRQRVQMSTTYPFHKPGVGQIGTGVEISGITRIRDEFLDIQIRDEQGTLGQYEARQEIIEQVEAIFMEPSDTGLNTIMGEMWNGWQELSKAPENSNARTIVSESSQTFADALNHMDEQLTGLKEDAISLMEKLVYDAHAILGQVNDLNSQISRILSKGSQPNDLLDQRDLLLDQLSDITDFTTEKTSDGQVIVKIGDKEMTGSNAEYEMSVVRSVVKNGENYEVTLVRSGDTLDGIKTFTLSQAEYEGSFSHLKTGEIIFNKKTWDGVSLDQSQAETFTPLHGKLKGYYSIQQETQSYQDQLDNLAKSIACIVNKIHQDGDTNNMVFFEGEGDTITAKNIHVNQLIIDDVSKINTGKDIPSTKPGDGSRALAIAQLRNGRFSIFNFDPNQLVYDPNTMTIENQDGGTTFQSYYKDIVAKLGISGQQAERMVNNQEVLLGQLEQRKESISGVSIDEEIANLVQYQHAYQANSKVMSTLTDMLDTLINRTGI